MMDMPDFKEQNDLEREYFKQDFSPVNILLKKVRQALLSGEPLDLSGLDIDEVTKFIPEEQMLYLRLFQAGNTPVRWGSVRKTLVATLNNCIKKLRALNSFKNFNVEDENACRIMLEVVTDRKKTSLAWLNENTFDEHRFEPGITGLELEMPDASHFYMPTDAIIESQMSPRQALNYLLRRTYIKNLTNSIPERIKILYEKVDHELYLLKSRAFVTYKDECLALYRGNTLYNDFRHDVLLEQFLKSSRWIVDNMLDDGKFTYYYDCKEDNNIDHEHPQRKEGNLYYNDLRHSGGIITLFRAYTLTKDEMFLNAAKNALEFSISITRSHEYNGFNAYYSYYNKKAKLGGSGLVLVSLMHYRMLTNDFSYDEYIKGYARHLISRMHESGEFLGYYIHPDYQNGEPLLNMTDKERMETFSYYYPGEALLGLAMFVNHFGVDDDLVNEVKSMTIKAFDWIVNERPKIYQHLFTSLPSDGWLMQAIEEWANNPELLKQEYLDFVFNDAQVMIDKTYKRDDSPFIDFEGGYYYDYGDHYYPDGARSEGLIAAYYLAKKIGNEELAQKILEGCKLTAKSQFLLYNSEEYSYAHKNPQKSVGSIRFKATRQWVRVDSIQHVACFFVRLYWAENPVGL